MNPQYKHYYQMAANMVSNSPLIKDETKRVNYIKSPTKRELPNQYEDIDEYLANKNHKIAQNLHINENGEIYFNEFEDNGLDKILRREESCEVRKKTIPQMPKPINEPEATKIDNKKNTIQHMDWNDYHRLDVIHNFIDELEYDFPSICTAGVIGRSLEGRDLKILKISNSDARNASVWLDAGIHAREWIAPAVATYIADHITKNFSLLPDSITNKDWYILPVMNPDGYEYSHTKDRMWRKNKAWHRGQCVGVDLNRNFSFGWGGKGSSDTPTNAFYRGPEPFSEPESSAVKDILSNTEFKFKVYITLHSYGQVIVFPFAFRDELCPDYVRLLEGATVMSKAIYECSGNTYKVGISRDVMYGADGTSNDWSYGAAAIPYCYLLELRSKKHKFKLPKEEIEETSNEILSCVKALMEFVDHYPTVTSIKLQQ